MGAIPILVIAVVQGWLLYGLHWAIDNKAWPATDNAALLAAYALAIFLPLTLELLAGRLRERITWLAAGAIGVVALALGAYAGWALGDQPLQFLPLCALYGALFLAWFVALPFTQARLRRGIWRAQYPDLFEFAWQNALVLAEAVVFANVFWLLLILWGALFKVIGISFFQELFRKPAFIYPVSALVFGYAIYLIETNERIVVVLRRHLLGVFAWLLPLVALIATLFVLALPFTGLAPLWKTGHATTLMLWLQLLFIHFLNSAYQDGQAEPRYPDWLKLALRMAVFALPMYAALCAYSLGLRVAQHGWTVSRVWAAIATFLAAAYGISYAVAAIRRTPWLGRLGVINVALAPLVAAVLLLTSTPLLDPKRISAESQLARLRAGSVTAAKFDYDYLRFELGRAGRAALEELSRDRDADIARLAAATLAKTHRYQPAMVAYDDSRAIAARIELLPPGTALDPRFVGYLQGALKVRPYDHPTCLRLMNGKPCVLLAVDLDGDGEPELVTIAGSYPLTVYGRSGGEWQRIGVLTGTPDERLARLGEFRTAAPAWREVVIGDKHFVVQPAR